MTVATVSARWAAVLILSAVAWLVLANAIDGWLNRRHRR
jgi:hypothetical protein